MATFTEHWLDLTSPADPTCEVGATLCSSLQLRQLEQSHKSDDLANVAPLTGANGIPYAVVSQTLFLLHVKGQSSSSFSKDGTCRKSEAFVICLEV